MVNFEEVRWNFDRVVSWFEESVQDRVGVSIASEALLPLRESLSRACEANEIKQSRFYEIDGILEEARSISERDWF